MPTYVMRHKETGEEKEMFLSMSAREQFLKDNPDWEPGIALYQGLVSDHKTAFRRAGTEWNDMLKNIKKGSGRGNTINHV